MEEIWKDISNLNGYEVSNLGKFRNKNTGKIIKCRPDGKGYLQHVFYYGGLNISKKLHRVVATVFIPNPKGLSQINHKDEDKTNNCVDNLEWCTGSYNNNYGTKNKRIAEKTSIGKIIQYDNNGNIIKTWISKSEIVRENSKGAAIYAAITKNSFNRYFNNSFWFKEDEVFDKKRYKPTRIFRVYKYGKLIGGGRISDVARLLNVTLNTITNAINKNKDSTKFKILDCDVIIINDLK